jgi:hypothetical protein
MIKTKGPIVAFGMFALCLFGERLAANRVQKPLVNVAAQQGQAGSTNSKPSTFSPPSPNPNGGQLIRAVANQAQSIFNSSFGNPQRTPSPQYPNQQGQNPLPSSTNRQALVETMRSLLNDLEQPFELADSLARFVSVSDLPKHLRAMLDMFKNSNIEYNLDELNNKLAILANMLYILTADTTGSPGQVKNPADAPKVASTKSEDESFNFMPIERVELMIGLMRRLENPPFRFDLNTVKSMMPEFNQLMQQMQQHQLQASYSYSQQMYPQQPGFPRQPQSQQFAPQQGYYPQQFSQAQGVPFSGNFRFQ